MNPIEAVSNLADPELCYRQLAPFAFHQELGLWVAASTDAATEVLSHPHCLVRPRAELVPKAFIGTPVGLIFEQLARMTDGEHHRQARALVLGQLSKWSAPDVARAVDEVWAAMPRNPHSAMWRLPVGTLARLLDFTATDAIHIAGQVEAFSACIAPGADLTVRLQPGIDAAVELWRAFEGRSPLEIANLIGILSQTCEASAGYIGTGAPSVHNTRRFVDEHIGIQGTRVPAGSVILVLLRNMPFGLGRHQCPGQALATMLATEALKRMPPLDPAGYRPSLNVRIPVVRHPDNSIK